MRPLSPAHIAFGDEVRLRRQELKWSQEKLSRAAGLHLSYVGQVERGQRNVSLTNILKIARALEIPATQLIASTEGIDVK